MNIHAPFVEVNVAAEYLGKTLDEVRTMVREGQVREFRDAGRIFFKTQDILELAGTKPEVPVGEADAATKEPELPRLTDFTYEALDGAGREVKGVVDAASREDATACIRGMGYFPTRIRPTTVVRSNRARTSNNLNLLVYPILSAVLFALEPSSEQWWRICC
jgi:hypothetical protein